MTTIEKLSKLFGFIPTVWRVEEYSEQLLILANRPDWKHDKICLVDEPFNNTDRKNMKLIALAPKLLKVLITEGLRLEEICNNCINDFGCYECNDCVTDIFYQFREIKYVCTLLGKTWQEVVEGMKE